MPTSHEPDDAMTEEKAQALLAGALEQLRRYPDDTLAQIVIADTAVELAETATGLAAGRDNRYPEEDVDAAARLLYKAQQLLEATVLAARLRGRSWDAIGEAVTGESGKKQTMSNRYGHLETEWQAGLLEPLAIDRDAWGGRGSVSFNVPDALAGDIEGHVARLERFLAEHHPNDRSLDLPEDDQPSTRIGDFLWRLNAAIEKYGVSEIPPALAADLDARKERNVAEGQAYLRAAERAAGKTTTEPDEEA